MKGAIHWTGPIVADLRLAKRQITARPIVAIAFILTMALGVGANAVVFSAVNAVFFKLPPVPGIERVVHAKAPARCDGGTCREPSADWVRSVAPRLATIAPVGGYSRRWSSVSAGNRSAILTVISVSGSYFDVLGVTPFAGRLLGPGDDLEAGGDGAVVSHQFWRDWLAGRTDAVGQSLTVGDRVFTIVGIASPGFSGLEHSFVQPTAVWVPLRRGNGLSRPRLIGTRFIGRLRHGSTLSAAADDLRGATLGLWEAELGTVEVSALPEALRDVPEALYATAALVLMPCVLIGCLAVSNLTILLFARLSGRLTEIATRITLGAARTDIVRMLAVEIALLVLAGAGAGMWIAAIVARLVEVPEFGGLHLDLDLSFDWRVFVYGLAVAGSAATVVISRVSAHVLEGDGVSLFGVTSAAGTVTFRNAAGRTRMIAFQAGAAVVVLALAGLFFRSAVVGSAADPTLDAERAGAVWINHDRQGHTVGRAAVVSSEVLYAVRAIPGVHSAALLSQMPGYAGRGVSLTGGDTGGTILGQTVVATDEFVDALGLRLIEGRRFTDADTAGSEPVVIVSDRVAALLWPGQYPVGRWLRWEEGPGGTLDLGRRADASTRRVVGVVSSVMSSARRQGTGRDVYVPLAQAAVEGDYLLVARGDDDGSLLAARLRDRLQQTHPAVSVFGVGALSEQFGFSSTGLKWMGGLLTSLGLIATVLAVAGLFGVIAHTAAIRRREIGIMQALGATHANLYRQASFEGFRMLLMGVVPAVLLALLLARLIRFSFLGFRWFDLQILLVVPAGVLLLGLIACILPVRSALQQPPLAVLRDS